MSDFDYAKEKALAQLSAVRDEMRDVATALDDAIGAISADSLTGLDAAWRTVKDHINGDDKIVFDVPNVYDYEQEFRPFK